MDKKVLAMFAISAAFLAVGCQKEKEVNDVLSSENTHFLIFTADKAGETRTAIASEEDGVVSYKWIEGDEGRMHIYEKSGEGENVSTKEGTITQMELTEDGKIATFHVTFEGNAPAGTVTYSATYGGKVSDSHNPYLPSEQNPGVDSFDPNADAMFASEITKPAREENPTFKFDMARVVSVNKMTLKGLPAGDKVESVTFESDKDHYGYITAEGNLTNKGKKLIMTYTENNTIPSSGEFPVYFTTAPVTDATFTVTVVTDKKRYVKTSAKTISFAVGQVRRFGVNLAGCEAEEGQTFTLVESVSDLKIGNLVIIAANGSKDIAMSIVQNTNNRGTTAAAKSSDYKKITVTEQVQLFTLEAGTQTGTYAFYCVNGDNEGYIYAASSSKNYLRTQKENDENGSWKISITNNEATITAQGTNTRNMLRYNSSSDIFSCYSSGEQSVYIYTASPLPDPGMYWSMSEASASITSNGIQFTAPTLTLGNASSVTYSSSNPSVATISSTGEVSVLAVGTTTISAVFPGNASYSASTVSYVLTVTDDRDQVAAPTFNPAAGSVEAGTIVTISSATEGATIYYTVDGSTPTTASTQGTRVTIDAAQTIKAIAVKDNFKNSIVATAAYTIATPDATIATILADNTITSSKTKHYELAGVTVMAAQGKNYVIGDATGVMLMYCSVSPALVVGNQYDVQGDVKLYNGVHEFNGPTVQASTGTAPSYGTPEQMTVSSLTAYATAPVTKYATVNVTAQASGYLCSDGTNSVNVFDGTGDFADYHNKPIVVTGYLIGYYDSKINILATEIVEDSTVPFITALKESVSATVAAAGVTDETESGVYSLANASDSDLSVTPDGTVVVSASVNGGSLTYSVSANTGASRLGYVEIAVEGGNSIRVAVNQDGASTSDTDVIVFSENEYSNGEEITNVSGDSCSITFDKGTNSNAPKYYNTGSAIRVYGGNSFTVSSEKTITEIVLTFASGEGSNAITTDVGTYSNGTWSGSAKSVKFSIGGTTGHRRIASISVSY